MSLAPGSTNDRGRYVRYWIGPTAGLRR